MKFNIKLANTVFEINSIYDYIYFFTKGYHSEERYEHIICITEDDIKKEQTANYKSEYLETLAVYRKIAEILANKNIILFHGALISVNNKGFLFTAKSGVGKTTHIMHYKTIYKDYVKIINGDKPLLEIKSNKIIGYGTPWSGKENLNSNESIRLNSIIFLRRSNINHIKQIDKSGAFPLLMNQIYIPENLDSKLKVIELVDKMVNLVNFFELQCTKTEESAIVSFEGLNK